MSSGIRIWGANGALQLDENSYTVRVIYSALIALEQTNTFISIPGVTMATCTAICLPNNGSWQNDSSSQDARVAQFDAQVHDGGVTVWSRNRNLPQGRVGVSTQRLLVLRYR